MKAQPTQAYFAQAYSVAVSTKERNAGAAAVTKIRRSEVRKSSTMPATYVHGVQVQLAGKDTNCYSVFTCLTE